MVRVAVAQFPAGEDKDANLAAAGALVAEAAGRGARLVVLPEFAMFAASRLDERYVAAAEPLDGPFVRGLGELAARHGAHVVAGVAESLDEPGRIANTLVALDPSGALAARYGKVHLYDAFGYKESDLVRPGDLGPPQTFDVEGVTFGMQTCYDVRFPEMTRLLVDAGADAVALPAQWVPGPLKEDHWRTLVRARAIENTIYVAAADQCAPAGAGNSMIIDPMGVVVASLGEGTGTAAGEISPGRLAEVREKNPALRLRRFGVTPLS
ncbi:carbon-nitrogen hydrolase family protein [Actinomadura viridis]|uniref:Amidohydrolase n=1 Tax=Actinomadura viridis TaxID=58110 RepID=A0A931DJ99_9ACTN|nr:carbon-nitrogen hydrolase family protein [Actinomadura viridis]MBG6088556.1 putative amidohydrolase [Actinomadura viridis]